MPSAESRGSDSRNSSACALADITPNRSNGATPVCSGPGREERAFQRRTEVAPADDGKPRPNGDYGTGTRAFSSSNQFSTTIILKSLSSPELASSVVTIKNRSPSGATS